MKRQNTAHVPGTRFFFFVPMGDGRPEHGLHKTLLRHLFAEELDGIESRKDLAVSF